MKVCITGKGGVGKTTIAAILARLLARSSTVVLVDADPNPNLALALGMGPELAALIPSVANVVLDERHAHAHTHEGEGDPPPDRGVEELVRDLGVLGPDGIHLVQAGHIERPSSGCLCCGSHRMTRRLLDELDSTERFVVADLEAGVNDLLWARPTQDDVVVIVTEVYSKALEVAKHALQVTQDLGVGRVFVLANRVGSEDDPGIVASALPGPAIVAIPDDPAIVAASRGGLSPLDAAPDCPAVTALATFLVSLVAAAPPAPAAAGG